MELNAIKGLKPTQAAALRRAGIRTVETLATVDARRKRVRGIDADALRALRKRAQTTIFHSAARQAKQIARDAKRFVRQTKRLAKKTRTAAARAERRLGSELQAVEKLIRDGTFAVLVAARSAQERAGQATHAARERASVVARVAAERAKIAARSAEKEYNAILRRLQRVPAPRRRLVKGYADKARSARDVAFAARDRAVDAANWARQAAASQAESVRQRSRSLFERVKSRRWTVNGG